MTESQLCHFMSLASMRDGTYPMRNVTGQALTDEMAGILRRLDGGCAPYAEILAETRAGDYHVRSAALFRLRIEGLAWIETRNGRRYLTANDDADEWLELNGKQGVLV